MGFQISLGERVYPNLLSRITCSPKVRKPAKKMNIVGHIRWRPWTDEKPPLGKITAANVERQSSTELP